MVDQVVTELVIDANTQGASDYERAMDSAAGAAQRGTDAATGFNVGLVALGASAVAAAATVNKALDYVVSFNKSLADMGMLADRVGLSLRDLQGIQFGGQIAGLTESQINAGLEKSAQLLNDAQRNANSLSKEFDANGVSLRNANGQLISQNQLLKISADLVSRARNPQDATAIAQMLGFTKEWVPLLQQGAGAMADFGNQAQAAGVVIDDETVKRAADFDAEWRKSSVQWSLYMKEAAASLLPVMDELIERAAKFFKSLDRDSIEKAANEQLSALSNSVGGPNADQTVGLRIDITPEAKQAVDELSNAGSLWDGWVKLLGVVAANQPLAKFRSLSPDEIKWYAGTGASITDTSTAQSDWAWQNQVASLKSMQAGLTGLQFGSRSNVAGKDTGEDPVDRAINSLRKHTEVQEADTRAVGLGDAALAAFRATAAETSAVQANGGKETAEQAARFAELRDRAAAAADALVRAKASSQIDFSSKTAFLSSDDVAIASQLKGIYGNDVPAALDSTYAAAIRTNNAFKGISSSIEGDLVSGLTDITTGAKSAGQGFTDMSNAIVKAIEQMIIKITIVEPLMRSLQSASSGLGLFSLGGAGGAGATSSTGFSGGLGGLYHTGGIIGSEPTSMRYVHGAYFDDAPRFHTGGIAGNEVPIIAQRGEGVFTPGQMAALGAGAGGGRSPQVTINNYTDASPAVEQAPNGDITVTLRKMVDGAVGDSLSTGTGRRVLGDQYGVKPFTGQ
ncbi:MULTISPECIES: hypothetical protein [Bradyrhizobium]|jgi:hypothetical protein|uniref:hypothetical protein n=1 Tax=Bradyrhizobium TaxID=374 RepID=UPI0004B92BEF|nr:MULTISPECIES: hypothetical protein [Bradyrhizobium]MDI2110481.1 hypothetical protein [Bradyrhizobium sp. Mp64]WLB04469.1 hypothetical protein QNJ80_21755 [Bradyrhizobium elkanii]